MLEQRIETRRGLVEDEQLGSVHERLHERDLLPIPSRQRSDRPVEVDGESIRQILQPSRVHAAAESREPVEELRPREPLVQRRVAGYVADPPPDRDRVEVRVETEHERAPARRAQEIEQEPDGRCLPGAVRAEEAEDRRGRHREVEIDDATCRAVRLGELLGFDGVDDVTSDGGSRQDATCARLYGRQSPPWRARSRAARGSRRRHTAVVATPERRVGSVTMDESGSGGPGWGSGDHDDVAPGGFCLHERVVGGSQHLAERETVLARREPDADREVRDVSLLEHPAESLAESLGDDLPRPPDGSRGAASRTLRLPSARGCRRGGCCREGSARRSATPGRRSRARRRC